MKKFLLLLFHKIYLPQFLILGMFMIHLYVLY